MSNILEVDFYGWLKLEKEILNPFGRLIHIRKINEKLGRGSYHWYDMGNGIGVLIKDFISNLSSVNLKQNEALDKVDNLFLKENLIRYFFIEFFSGVYGIFKPNLVFKASMDSVIFQKQHDTYKEILMLFKILSAGIITIFNPIAWIVYFAIYIIGKTAGEDKNVIYLTSQWTAFIVGIISLILAFIYFIYRIT
ncbi:MAG: hypothetical protein WCR69_03695 [Sulfuricurvum sp.]